MWRRDGVIKAEATPADWSSPTSNMTLVPCRLLYVVRRISGLIEAFLQIVFADFQSVSYSYTGICKGISNTPHSLHRNFFENFCAKI